MRIRPRDGWAWCLTEGVGRMGGRRKIYQVTSDVRWKATHPSSSKYTHGGSGPVFEDSDPTPSTIKSSAMVPLSSPHSLTFCSNTKNFCESNPWRLAFLSPLFPKFACTASCLLQNANFTLYVPEFGVLWL